MKIVLNAVAFIPGRMGGVESYFRNLLSSLQEIDAHNDYLLICNQRYIDSLSLSNPHFKFLPCAYAKPSKHWYLRAAIRHATKLDILRPFMNGLAVDVIHHPFSILQPIRHTTPSVLTFHDMQHEFFPEYFTSYALQAREALYRPSAEQATRIIAISEYVKMSLVDRYRIDADKIDVVYEGHCPEFRIIDNPDHLESVRSRYDLRKPFMYYPAATWPHKNHKRLLAALRIMKERNGFDGQLVLSGIAMQANDGVVKEIERLGLHNDVVMLGYLPGEDLPALYNLARLMVFPSLHEGFGIPLLEAMACGCPITCSHATSIPEIAADAALFFDPASEDDIARNILKLWDDNALRQEMVTRGVERAQFFSHEKMAHMTLNVYEKAAG